MPRQTSIFAEGAVLLTDFVTAAEEERILLRISQNPWITELRRRVQHYGYRYDYARSAAPEPATPFPAWASAMADRMREHFADTTPVQCIVNEYRPGQTIGMHADHAQFGPVVASLSLAADWPMRFRPRGGQPYARGALASDETAVLPRRSLLVLSGPARHRWMHGIAQPDSTPRTATRVSATFRTLASTPGRP